MMGPAELATIVAKPLMIPYAQEDKRREAKVPNLKPRDFLEFETGARLRNRK
jgi:hypothetical protein